MTMCSCGVLWAPLSATFAGASIAFGMKVTGLRYRDLKGAKAGILWYHTGRSRHYVLVRRCEGGRYAFPNSAAPGPMDFPDFYSKYVKHLRLTPLHIDLPIMFTLTLDRRDKNGRHGKK